MNRRIAIPLALAIGGSLLLAGLAKGEEKGVDWKTLQAAKTTLENGLAAAGPQGKAISAKFEMEEGKLQLSVYTSKDGRFFEVIIDHGTGKIAKTEEIKEGEDLSAAKTQSAAMAKAKRALQTATEQAVAANAGYRAVSVIPSLQSGRSVAAVTLIGSGGTKTVSQSLE